MNRLGHCDRIPRLLAYFEQEHEFFLVQELIEGHDLSQEILPGKPWTEAQTIELLQDTLEVLLIVQQQNVIHRDLKPSNLMRRRQDNKIILIDFGSVKQVSTQTIDAAGQIKQTVAVGTKSYMPMEQMMGRPGFYSDIYALGIIAIQALTGTNPQEFPINDHGEIIWRNKLDHQVHYQPRFLDLLDRMVRYRHHERYTSARVVLADLKQLDAAHNNFKETVIISKKIAQPEPQQSDSGLNDDPKTGIVNSQSTPRNNTSPQNQAINQTTVITSKGKSVKSSGKSHTARSTKSKSKLILSPLIAGVLTSLGAIGGWILLQDRSTEPEIRLVQYENSREGFRVDYPQDWSKQNRDDFVATGVIFFSPLENDADQFKEKVSVLVENIPSNLSLSEYTKQSISEIKQLSDPNIGEAQPIILGINEGRQIIYRGEENGRAVQRMQTWSVKGNRAYVITYTAKPESYDNYLPMVEKIIESFATIK